MQNRAAAPPAQTDAALWALLSEDLDLVFPLPAQLPRETADTVRPGAAPPPVASCGCGRSYDEGAWSTLPLVADRWEGLQLRNCSCHSTIAMEVAA